MQNKTTGQRGEDRAARWLEASGFKIVERNYRCRAGEADIVGWDGRVIYLIEVKARGSRKFGLPAEAIGRDKLRRMERVAQSWTRERAVTVPVRLAVITILGEGEPELITEIEAVD